MRGKSIDYFENSRRATYAQQKYAIFNPRKFDAYGENCWGITASDGPGDITRKIKGKERQFFGYLARGVSDGPDDGSIAPWAVVASLPFAPEIVLPALRYYEDTASAGLLCANGNSSVGVNRSVHSVVAIARVLPMTGQ